MSKQYSCDLCKKVFNQKIDFTRHQNKKAPCITMNEIQKLTETKEKKTDNKNTLITVFKNCLNIMRDNEGLTGEKALRTLSYLLILKLLEPHFGCGIDIDGYDYDFNIPDELVENHKNKLLEIVRFTNLANEKEDNIQTNMQHLWDDILSNHPTTKHIFLKGKGFDIQHQSTYKKLIDKLVSLDLSQTEYDVLGNAYEEVIKDIMTGKVLGQFFTQPIIKTMMVKLIDPQIYPDGKIDTCGDPTMGTGGFLTTYLLHILQQAKSKNIQPDWNFIKTEGLYGKELEPDTYQLAVSNMLISSGHMFDRLDRGDSIRQPITRKFDNILANPPFGINGFNYDDFQSPLKNEYTPIKSDNAVSLFIQAIIYMLKIGGKCAVVLPYGQELTSTNTKLVAIREYLVKTCDLKEVIYLPSGMFTYTDIKTCVFYFVKKREGTDVLKTDIKISKTQKETGREYEFSETHQTTTVKFYDCNPYEDVKNLLVEVPIELLASKSYSLNYTKYMKDEAEEKLYESGIVMKKLGEVCKDIPTSKNIASSERIDGTFRFFTCSRDDSTHNEYHYDGTFIVHGSRGTIKESVFITDNEKFAIGTNMFISQVKDNNECLPKYIYYYLKLNPSILDKYINGVAIPMISKSSYYDVKIPLPPLERQQEIVKYLDFICEKTNKTSMEKIKELKLLNDLCLQNQYIISANVVNTLGEICNFKNGKGIKKDNLVEGDYPVIGGGQKPMGFHNDYNTNENVILCSSSGAYAGFVSKYDKKVWASDCFSIIPKVFVSLNNNYLYYFLKSIQTKIYKLQTGTAQPHVYSKDLLNFKIPIPSIERQKEIVDHCQTNELLISQLEKEIENNKIQAQQFLSHAL